MLFLSLKTEPWTNMFLCNSTIQKGRKRTDSIVLYNIEKESLIAIQFLILYEDTMGICPYCKQYIDLHNVKIEKKGKGIEEQDRIYVCPCCDYILGFSSAMK
jgi:hypothetical protein